MGSHRWPLIGRAVDKFGIRHPQSYRMPLRVLIVDRRPGGLIRSDRQEKGDGVVVWSPRQENRPLPRHIVFSLPQPTAKHERLAMANDRTTHIPNDVAHARMQQIEIQ